MDARWYLGQVNLFRVLSEEELVRLERLVQMRTVPKGGLIMEPSRPANVVYFIKKGRVRLYKLGADGRLFVVAFLGPGNLFGETEVFSTGTADLFAQAADDAVLCAPTRAQLEALMRRQPELAIKLVETLTSRLREAEQRLRELAHERVERRLLHLLVRLAGQFGSRHGDWLCLEVRLTHEELAGMIGSTRETVTSTLSGLLRQGVIRMRQGILRTGAPGICLYLPRVMADPELQSLLPEPATSASA